MTSTTDVFHIEKTTEYECQRFHRFEWGSSAATTAVRFAFGNHVWRTKRVLCPVCVCEYLDEKFGAEPVVKP